MELFELADRWLHFGAGVLWIGLLYFFNWVNSAFAPTMDAETKKKVIPELMPRCLFWFRWGAMYTWI
ncbi:MAG: antitermination protein NusG, partial [Planctomycetota bacterium]|nr:antitermination protein NusG [Planctomycetota bacterium]